MTFLQVPINGVYCIGLKLRPKRYNLSLRPTVSLKLRQTAKVFYESHSYSVKMMVCCYKSTASRYRCSSGSTQDIVYRSHEVDRRRNTEAAADSKEVEKLLKVELQ